MPASTSREHLGADGVTGASLIGRIEGFEDLEIVFRQLERRRHDQLERAVIQAHVVAHHHSLKSKDMRCYDY